MSEENAWQVADMLNQDNYELCEENRTLKRRIELLTCPLDPFYLESLDNEKMMWMPLNARSAARVFIHGHKVYL